MNSGVIVSLLFSYFNQEKGVQKCLEYCTLLRSFVLWEEGHSGLMVTLLGSLFQALSQWRMIKKAVDEQVLAEKKTRSHLLLYSPASRSLPTRFVCLSFSLPAVL